MFDIFNNPLEVLSVCTIPGYVLNCRQLSANSKLIFGLLWKNADGNGEARTSYGDLVDKVGINIMQAVNGIDELKKLKFIRETRIDTISSSVFYAFPWHDIVFEKMYFLPRNLSTTNTCLPWELSTSCIIPDTVLNNAALPASAKLIFGVLSMFVGESGELEISYNDLSYELNLGHSYTKKMINELVKLKVISKISQSRPDGGTWANKYIVFKRY